MNPGFLHGQQTNSPCQFGNAGGPCPPLDAPNFSGFSASPDKPFLPMFGVPLPTLQFNGDSSMSNRKRRIAAAPVEMEMDARQRKVFITEERMVRGMSRLNLDQGPDILQDLTPPADELLNEEDLDIALKDAADSKSDMAAEVDFDGNMTPPKIVLSDTLKHFVDRSQPILPTGVMERISQQVPANPSRELVVWQPPGQQIRDVIRKSLMKTRDQDEDEPEEMMSQSAREETGERLPDLLLSGDGVRRSGALTDLHTSPSPSWTFEQMET